MPDDQGRLFADEIAEKVGIRVGDWRARVSRAYAPKPVDYVVVDGMIRGVWDPAAIDEYLKTRDDRVAKAYPADETEQ